MQQEKADAIRPKRKYEKKPKIVPSSAANASQQTIPASLPIFNAKDMNQYDFPSSDEDPLSQVWHLQSFGSVRRNILSSFFLSTVFFLKVFSGSSEAEEENDPDGPFAFRRKAGCQYYAVSLEFL